MCEQDDSDLVFDDELWTEADGVDERRPVRVKREPPSLESDAAAAAAGRRSASRLAAHGLWSAKKHPSAHHRKQEHVNDEPKKAPASASSAKAKRRDRQQRQKTGHAASKHDNKAHRKRLAALRIGDDEDMLADGSGSGEGPVPAPPASGTRSKPIDDRFLSCH